MTSALPQFGQRRTGVTYRPRAAAHVVVLDEVGRVALVEHIGWLFLPGGGTEEGENARQTVEREVEEECGRTIAVDERLGSARQLYVCDDGAFDMIDALFTGHFVGPPVGKGEHPMSWLDPAAAAPRLYHACHRWAIDIVASRRGV